MTCSTHQCFFHIIFKFEIILFFELRVYFINVLNICVKIYVTKWCSLEHEETYYNLIRTHVEYKLVILCLKQIYQVLPSCLCINLKSLGISIHYVQSVRQMSMIFGCFIKLNHVWKFKFYYNIFDISLVSYLSSLGTQIYKEIGKRTFESKIYKHENQMKKNGVVEWKESSGMGCTVYSTQP